MKKKPKCDHIVGYFHFWDEAELVDKKLYENFRHIRDDTELFNYCPKCGAKLEKLNEKENG